MTDIYNSAFSTEDHTQWCANQYAWDPSQLQVLPSAGSPATGSDGAPSDHFSEGHGSSTGGQRDQSLGPIPLGWQESAGRAANGAACANAGGKDVKGAQTRAPKGPLVCQVEGCGHDLSVEKGYYQRYRVCEPHMKLLSIVIQGKACRFCQQCGRFQELTEFDGNKRSCRARLQQHNARRRKRDPLDTSRKEHSHSRKSKSTHPWSDSSNDADMGGPGSGDLSQGGGIADNMKTLGPYSGGLNSGIDEGVKMGQPHNQNLPASLSGSAGMPTAAAPAAAWPSGWSSGSMLGQQSPSMEIPITPASVQPQAMVMNNLLAPMPQPPMPNSLLQQAQPQSQQVNGDLARCFSGEGDPNDPLEEMLDSILNSCGVDMLDDPRMSLPQPTVFGAAASVMPCNMAASTGMSASMGMGDSVPGFQAEIQSTQIGMCGMAGMRTGTGVAALGGNPGPGHLGDMSGRWQSRGVPGDAAPGGLAAAAAVHNGMMQQRRQFQELQVLQHQQQQLQKQQLQQQQIQQQLQLEQQLQQRQQLRQQQMQQQMQLQQQLNVLNQQQQPHGNMMARSVIHTGGSSMMQMDGPINSNSSSVMSAATPYDLPLNGPMGSVNGLTANSGIVGRPNSNPSMALQRSAGNMTMPYGAIGHGTSTASVGVSSGLSMSGGLGGNRPAVGLSGITINNGLGHGLSGSFGTSAATAGAPPAMSGFELARRLVAGGGAAAQYQSEDLLVRVSIKVANCTPEQLPPDLYQRLRNLLNTADASLVQGFLRPGCTHLVLDVAVNGVGGLGGDPERGNRMHLVDAGSPATGLPIPLVDLRGLLGAVAGRCAVLVQTDEEVALWRAGTTSMPQAPCSIDRVKELQSAGHLPVLHHVSSAAHIDVEGRTVLVAYGSGLLTPGVELFARSQGGYLPLRTQALVAGGQVAPSAAVDPDLATAANSALRCSAALHRAGQGKPDDVLLVTVENAPGTGLLMLEAQVGPLLSNWRPCLMSMDARIASELCVLEGKALGAGAAALASLQDFVTDLGRLLDRRSYVQESPIVRRSASSAEEHLAEDVDAWGGGMCINEDFTDGSAQCDASDPAVPEDELVFTCERLLAWSADAGLAHTSIFLASALVQYGQDARAILEAPYADGLAVIHRCMRSGSSTLVAAMLAWMAERRVQLDWGSVGALGLSPLHLAALVPASWQALAACKAVRASWSVAAAVADGTTPETLQSALLAELQPCTLPREILVAFNTSETVVAAIPACHGADVQLGVAEEDAQEDADSVLQDALSELPEDAEQSASTETLPKTSIHTGHLLASRGYCHTLGRSMASLVASVLLLPLLALLITTQFAGGRPATQDVSSNGAARLRPSLLQRLAPETELLDRELLNCCSSVLCVGLLGVAACLLPSQTAANLLSRIHPASTCLGAP